MCLNRRPNSQTFQLGKISNWRPCSQFVVHKVSKYREEKGGEEGRGKGKEERKRGRERKREREEGRGREKERKGEEEKEL